jgi:hypothetical protein
MAWDGTERRKGFRGYCDGHLKLEELVTKTYETSIRTEERVIALDKRVNGTVGDVKTHISNSRPRNIAIIGVGVTIFVWMFSLAVEMGAHKKQVEINTQRWEQLIRVQSIKS